MEETKIGQGNMKPSKKQQAIKLFTEAGDKLLQGIFVLDPVLENDENFVGTAARFGKGFMELVEGVGAKNGELEVMFTSRFDEMVVEGPIAVVSTCPHHLLAVYLKIYVAYIPHGKAVGLSKLVRMVKRLARRPVLQETLTQDIVQELTNKIKPQPRGAMCVVVGLHSCMSARGVKTTAPVTTSAIQGVFMGPEGVAARSEFFSLLVLSEKHGFGR